MYSFVVRVENFKISYLRNKYLKNILLFQLYSLKPYDFIFKFYIYACVCACMCACACV